MSRFTAAFATPARQALGWTALGILGVILATTGAWLFLAQDGSPPPASPGVVVTPTPTPTATPSPTPTATPTPSPTPTPTPPPPTPTPRPVTGGSPGVGGGGPSGGQPAPTPTPTPPPVPARAYCPPSSSDLLSPPTARVAGALTRAGVPVPAGSVEVSVTFDGVPGPSRLNVSGGFGIDFYAGGETCANRAGAAIGVLVEGRQFPSGYTVGAQPQLVVINVDLP